MSRFDILGNEDVKRSMLVTRVALLLSASLLLSFSSVYPISVASLTSSTTVQVFGSIVYPKSTPLLGGWGGVRLSESARYTGETNNSLRTSPKSVAFEGEVASNAEMAMLYMKNQGWNAIRAYWEPPTSQQSPEWGYNSEWMARMINIAKALGMYVIIDCHGYTDAYQYNENWTDTWTSIISTFRDSYTKIVWEPINEPLVRWSDGTHALIGKAAVDQLATIYQSWIHMCRGLADTHWIVVSGVEWTNSLPNMVDWYPAVTDPLDQVYYTWHYYYFYDDEPTAWTVTQAQAKADYYLNTIIDLTNRYNRPYICTEIGAQSYYGSTPPPDLQCDGAAGYSNISLAFVQRLVTNFDNYTGRVGYLLWTAGDWAKDKPTEWHYSGLYGAMDVWGGFLVHKSFW